MKRETMLTINQNGWNKVAHQFHGGTALPKYGPLADTEEELNLIAKLNGRCVLELGCGSGHTLAYLHQQKNAGELWGLDFSEEQIRYTRETLAQANLQARLFLAAMDENPGLPENYFDLVISIYALGWTPDLSRTLSLIHSYLKPGGTLIFSWEHPIYRCLQYDATTTRFAFTESYLDETPEHHPSWKGVEIFTYPRKLSTYLNALTGAGLVLEQLIESDVNPAAIRDQDLDPEKWYSLPRAWLVPTTFIVKARKPA